MAPEMTQTPIPFLFMRGGTSRGPYLLRKDLPRDRDTLSRVLVAMIGSGHPINIDGIGGGVAVTTKVAMLSRPEDDWADVDYLFAQVSVGNGQVDYRPTCGNILAGVGPAAIETGLVPVAGKETVVRIRAVNTNARVCATVRTPDGAVSYDGNAAIDGVPGTASPIELSFMDTVGSMTGSMFPTGRTIERIDDIPVSCLDVAMPMVIARASDLGIDGSESAAELAANRALMQRIETIRLVAGERMGMGDVAASVTPKFGLVAKSRHGGTIAVRYFMPWDCHPSLAVTGAQCLAACCLAEGTVCDGMGATIPSSPAQVQLEHPAGTMDVTVEFRRTGKHLSVISSGIVRTARKLAAGTVFIPGDIWSGHPGD